MQIIIISIRLIFWMIVIPYCLGIPLASRFGMYGRTIEMTLVSGYFLMVSIFQIYYLFFVLFYNHFIPLVWLSAVTFLLIAICSVIKSGKYHIGGRKYGRHKKKVLEICLWIGFAVLFGIQLIMTVMYAYPDGDDAFYAVTALITETNNNMYINIPYTGETSVLDKRHAFSSAPIFIAFLGRVCSVHPVVMSNVFFSIAVIILTYMLYKLIAVELLEDKKEYIPLFMITICILYLFGNSTIYQNTTFLITRTGQGKAFLANVIPIASILGLLLLNKNLENKDELNKSNAALVLLSLVMLAAGYTSTMGMFMGPLLIGGGILLLAIRYKLPLLLFKLFIIMLPTLICGGFYIIFAYL
ncbi:MAG: DUF6077 domain-containing protein [Bacteroidales bacterium]|nr:DUF6077 domain-containing protein [Bacteroidales bacterium]